MRFQNLILEASPALFPLLAILYSFLTSFHCSFMCSPLLPMPPERNKYFIFRMLSYSFFGGLFGLFGEWLRNSIEYKLFSALAFLVFAISTLSIVGVRIIPKKYFWDFHSIKKERGGIFRGVLSAFIPCHSLFFFYSMAVMTSSVWGGFIILFGHAMATMPALAYGRQVIDKITLRFKYGKSLIHFIILILCLINLSYFGSRIFHSEEGAKSKILFCF